MLFTLVFFCYVGSALLVDLLVLVLEENYIWTVEGYSEILIATD